MELIHISRFDSLYPKGVREYPGGHSPEVITALGNFEFLKLNKKAFFCSAKCPGAIIIKTFDYFRDLKHSGKAIISGFHSPLEKECLKALLKGDVPVIICLARSLDGARLDETWNTMAKNGKLLILSPFPEGVKRVSAKTALLRNDFIAAISDEIFVPYAAPGSKTEAFCRKILDWGKPLFTFDSPENAHLLSLGISTIRA